MKRDSQRSKVYAWERAIGYFNDATEWPIEQCEAYARQVWRSERGRYGLARRPAPAILRGRGRSVAAYGGGWIRLARRGRRPMTILHELAHCLNPGGRHDARFAGIVTGLYCRHLGMDSEALLGAALEFGVKVNLTAIGKVPDYGWHRRAVDALERLGGKAANLIELAGEMGVSYRVAWGACLSLIRANAIRRRGKGIVLVAAAEKNEGAI